VAASKRIARGLDTKLIAGQFALPDAVVRDVIAAIRIHRPTITLPAMTAAALQGLRPAWKIGVVTDGLPDVQARRVAALGSNRWWTASYTCRRGGRWTLVSATSS
jgi:hypothetical protein